MKVAAVVTSYNEGELLRAALNRLGDQIRPPDEIIVVDDGSTDRESLQVAAYYQDQQLRHVPGHRVWPTKFIRLPANVGVARAMVRGLNEVTADLVWFTAVDDLPRPDLLSSLVPELEAGARLACGLGRLDGRWKIGRFPSSSAAEMRERGHLICSHATVARTEDMRHWLNAAFRWHCDFAAHHLIAHLHGAVNVNRVLVEIARSKTSYSERGQRSEQHVRVLSYLAILFAKAPAVLGHLGLGMARHLHRPGLTFWRHALRRSLGRCLRSLNP